MGKEKKGNCNGNKVTNKRCNAAKAMRRQCKEKKSKMYLSGGKKEVLRG